ncbi:class D sortase, partial [Bacillus haynesii]|nr:class D sortase [Bacillus haynesii]
MKKNLPILIIAAGLVLIGYGVWKVVDTSKKTEQTLEAAKLA